jgi:hypothetical protein
VPAPSPSELRRKYLLDPEIAFLNHGSFGACPRPVFERYQSWQRELEREPVDFLALRLPDLLGDARTTLAAYLRCAPTGLALAPDAMVGQMPLSDFRTRTTASPSGSSHAITSRSRSRTNCFASPSRATRRARRSTAS